MRIKTNLEQHFLQTRCQRLAIITALKPPGGQLKVIFAVVKDLPSYILDIKFNLIQLTGNHHRFCPSRLISVIRRWTRLTDLQKVCTHQKKKDNKRATERLSVSVNVSGISQHLTPLSLYGSFNLLCRKPRPRRSSCSEKASPRR